MADVLRSRLFGSRIFRTVAVFNCLVQFHTVTLTTVSKHGQISSLKASRQIKETTANDVEFLY